MSKEQHDGISHSTRYFEQKELIEHCKDMHKEFKLYKEPAKKMSEEINWQERYDHLVESLPKNKRPFSDKQAQKVIASQVKRITQLEDDLSFVRCELDKLRKKNPASGC